MEEAEDYKKEGTKAYNSREYKKAIDLYTKAISKREKEYNLLFIIIYT